MYKSEINVVETIHCILKFIYIRWYIKVSIKLNNNCAMVGWLVLDS